MRSKGLEPSCLTTLEPKPSASTNFANPAFGGDDRSRTCTSSSDIEFSTQRDFHSATYPKFWCPRWESNPQTTSPAFEEGGFANLPTWTYLYSIFKVLNTKKPGQLSLSNKRPSNRTLLFVFPLLIRALISMMFGFSVLILCKYTTVCQLF